MAHNFQRPGLPYAGEALQNDKRYQLLTRSDNRPPTDSMLDTDFNYLIDAVRQLDKDMSGVSVGILPGSDDPQNAGFFPTTDGGGNISWTDVSDQNIRNSSITAIKLAPGTLTELQMMDGTILASKLAPNCITTTKMVDFNVTANKLAPDSVLTDKINDNAVTTSKIADSNVTTVKVADSAITTAKIADLNVTTPNIAELNVTTSKIADSAVTTAKILDNAVTPSKIGSGSALENTFLAADGAGNASFINNIGRILQIVNFEITDTLYDQTPCSPANPISFSSPFLLRITPKKTGSKIILYYSANISGGGNSYYGVVLCRNNAIWKVGTTGGEGGFDGGVTSGGYTFTQDNYYGTPCFSNVFIDTGTINQQIVYELKKGLTYVTLNRSANDRLHTISTMVAIEVDI